jgi:hypothetical protein
MKDTHFSVPEEKKARLAGRYAIVSQTGKPTAFESQVDGRGPWCFSPAGVD